MDLHANAALSLNKRRALCHRVVDEQRTVTEAAEAAEVSVSRARKWVRRYRALGEAGRAGLGCSGGQPQANRAARGIQVDGLSALGHLETAFRNEAARGVADGIHVGPEVLWPSDLSCRLRGADRLAWLTIRE